MILDCFPFFNENDVLEIRLNELSGVVDKFLILEAEETYGGDPKPLNFDAERFKDFPIAYRSIKSLEPRCTDRVSGRKREAFQRNEMLRMITETATSLDDVVIFSDCDEIPSADSVRRALPRVKDGPQRFKQRSFYYNVNTLVDYGNDFASRCRIASVKDVLYLGSMYEFRMCKAEPIECGGWHFGYFGGEAKIREKVSALSPFLSEYKIFDLEHDIRNRKDLHHRRCEMPETFYSASSTDETLPQYLLDNPEKFKHFHASNS